MDIVATLTTTIFQYQNVKGIFDVVKDALAFFNGSLDLSFLPSSLSTVLVTTLGAVLVYKVVCHLL